MKTPTTDGLSPVWIMRPLRNWPDMYRWGVAAGIKKMMPPDQLHLTLATVRVPVRWDDLELRTDELIVPAGPKPVQIFGFTIKGLTFTDGEYSRRHAELLTRYPQIDHPVPRPHVSLYKGGRMPRMTYDGPLVFGPERACEFDATNTLGIKHVVIADMI